MKMECNRKSGDEYFNTIDTCADMNGDVGKQGALATAFTMKPRKKKDTVSE